MGLYMPHRILIVDDSKLARKVLKDALPVPNSFDISEAGNGMEALEFCRHNPVDILFLDLTMPVMDGYEFLEKMQSEGLRPAIVVVSADVQPKAKERVVALGARAFIGKPVNPSELSHCLQEQGFL